VQNADDVIEEELKKDHTTLQDPLSVSETNNAYSRVQPENNGDASASNLVEEPLQLCLDSAWQVDEEI
jgi:hypothetical protein